MAAIKSRLALIVFALCLQAQTRVRPEQIRNWQQFAYQDAISPHFPNFTFLPAAVGTTIRLTQIQQFGFEIYAIVGPPVPTCDTTVTTGFLACLISTSPPLRLDFYSFFNSKVCLILTPAIHRLRKMWLYRCNFHHARILS